MPENSNLFHLKITFLDFLVAKKKKYRQAKNQDSLNKHVMKIRAVTVMERA